MGRTPAARPRRPVRTFAVWFLVGLAASPGVAFLVRGKEAAPAARGSSIEGSCLRAKEHLAAERYSEAYLEYSLASRIAPSDPRPWVGLGDVYRRIDLDQLAEDSYRKAIALDPGSRPARVSLAMLLCEIGKNDEAVSLLRAMGREDPGDPFLWAELAINALHRGKPREAIPLLEKYNRVEGRQSWGWANLGRAHADAGDLEPAEKAYREALAVNPRSPLPHLWLGQLLIEKGRKEEADRELKTFRELRDLQTQARLLEQAVSRQSGDVMGLVRLAEVRRLLGQTREALAAISRALDLAPGNPEVRRLHEAVSREAGVSPPER